MRRRNGIITDDERIDRRDHEQSRYQPSKKAANNGPT